MTSAVFEYWRREIWVSAISVWDRLDIPSWDKYRPALQEFTADVWKASQSTAQLSVLTLRPIAILCWMIFEAVWQVAQLLFRVLLSQGWIQLKKGLIQLQAAARWFYHFQLSLSRTEILGEVALLGMSVAIFYLYKWIRRQAYWQRFMKWYNDTKLRALERTTKFFDRVARVSLILAMALPHMAFAGGYCALKLVFPSLVKWMAYDTYTTALLSIWYPLIMTLSWVHEARQTKNGATASTAATCENSIANEPSPKSKSSTAASFSDDRSPSYMRSTASKKSRERDRKRLSGVFSRTNPPKPETPRGRGQKQRPAVADQPEAATRYWLRYWVVFALVQSLGTLGAMVPVFGNFVAQHPFVLHICSELKLLFFIWLFAMENLIGATVVEEDALMAKSMPLALLHEHITPLLLEFEAVVAEAVSQTTWKTLVHSKSQRILEVLVMLKMLSETRKDWLLHILEEGRTLLLPSLSLFMPSFITQFGVAYVQFIVPSAKSIRVLNSTQKPRKFISNTDSQDMELLYLQYWIIHCLASFGLAYFSSILWWVPFSTHAIFLMWCHISFPKSIVQSYGILETELIAFGMLPGESDIQLHETKTAQVLQAVYRRLPSAADAGEDVDTTENEELTIDQMQDSSSRGFDQTVSVDSQQTNVEVSIREPRLRKEGSHDASEADDDDAIEIDENDPPTKLVFDSSVTRKPSTEKTPDDDKDWLSPTKSSGSAFTAGTGSTFVSQDLVSLDSASINSATCTASNCHTDSLRRSTRQRRKAAQP